jgi:methanogenic corrinoid protein MtbC1
MLETQRPGWFDKDVYERSHADIRALKAGLPEATVVSLAQEVLTRLAERAHSARAVDERAISARIGNLGEALISQDDDAVARVVSGIRADGASPESVYLTYLAGAARLLGEWWEESRVSFAQVTIGTCRIYSIMRAMRHLFAPMAPIATRSAVFAAVPGETHTLGISMAADLFRKEGWDIELKIGRSHDELVAEIRDSSHRLIGLSCAGRHSSAALARLIIALRISNPLAYILVSGHVLDDARNIASALGADGIATDVPSARAILDTIWDRPRADGAGATPPILGQTSG